MYNEAVAVKMTMSADVADIGNSRKTVRVVLHEKRCAQSNMAMALITNCTCMLIHTNSFKVK